MASRSRSKQKSIGRWKTIFANEVGSGTDLTKTNDPKAVSTAAPPLVDPPSAQGKSNSKSRDKKENKKKKDGTPKSKEDAKDPEREKVMKSDNERSIEEQRKTEPKKEAAEASIFEEVQGPAQPAQAHTHGVKNKMRWKIDVEPVDVNGSQHMEEILDKTKELKRKARREAKQKNKLKVTNKSGDLSQEDEISPDDVYLCAKILQLIKMQKLIEKEVKESDQEMLKNYCRSGSDEDKAIAIIEKLALSSLSSIVTKNDMCRVPTIPGQLRMYAVDEKTARSPMMALMIVRKDLLYVSWSKSAEIADAASDATWSSMTKKGKEEKEK